MYRKRMALISLFLPYVVIFLNLDVIGSYEYSFFVIFLLIYMVYKDFKKDLLDRNFKMYINVLANPSGYENEMVFPSAFTKDEWDEPFNLDEDYL